jgi:hypothetical protein
MLEVVRFAMLPWLRLQPIERCVPDANQEEAGNEDREEGVEEAPRPEGGG